MFARDTAITMWNGTKQKAEDLAALDNEASYSARLVATKKGAGNRYCADPATIGMGDKTETIEGATELVLPVPPCALPIQPVRLTTASGRTVTCHPDAKVMLGGGGFCLAKEAQGAIIDTEASPETVTAVDWNTPPAGLDDLRLISVHAILANGIWFLTEAVSATSWPTGS